MLTYLKYETGGCQCLQTLFTFNRRFV